MKGTIEIKMKAVIFSEEGTQSVTEVLGWLTPHRSITKKSISMKTENISQADKNFVHKTDIKCNILKLELDANYLVFTYNGETKFYEEKIPIKEEEDRIVIGNFLNSILR